MSLSTLILAQFESTTMRWFEIEHADGTGNYCRFLVHAKTYEEGANKIRQHHGDGTFKLLAVFENMEIDKKILKRFA